MKLFDDFERSEKGPSLYSESNFNYLNRSSLAEFEKVRGEIERWFSRYPEKDKKDLLLRFRSDIEHQHQSAFFELFLHELLIRLNCHVDIHPPLTNTSKSPDFLVIPPDGHSYYMEATVVLGDSFKVLATHTRENVVYDALNRLVNSPYFFLWLSVHGAPNTPPPAKKIASRLNIFLAELDPEFITEQYNKHGFDILPKWTFVHDGWEIEIRPIPKQPNTRGKPNIRPIGMQSTEFRWVDDRTPLRDSIIDKASRYGELDFPYIIAVNVLKPVDKIDIMEALFGKEQYTLFVSEEDDTVTESQFSRKPDGVWNGPNGPQHTRVNGVLIATHLSPWNIANTDLCLYYNPWTKNDHTVLKQLTKAIPEEHQIKWIDGDTTSKIFNLPISWPKEEFDF